LTYDVMTYEILVQVGIRHMCTAYFEFRKAM
jgi:hypothetical protein